MEGNIVRDDLSDFDFTSFFRFSQYVQDRYVAPPPSLELVQRVEADLGVKLPEAYKTLATHQNGGAPVNDVHAAPSPTSWADDHVAISAIFSISYVQYGLCGEMGTRFWTAEWGYPGDLIYFADCPSGGHDMVALNYRDCGPDGEPTIVHVDQEDDYLITEIAPDFGSFIRGLVSREPFD